MKNALLATTALVAFGFAGAASAAEPLKATIGGYMNVGVGITNNDAGDDVLILRDGEVHFSFKGSSDNGLTFDGRIELEAFTDGGGDQIDENWARVSGSFGAIMIGGNDTAMNTLSEGVIYAPGVFGYYDATNPKTFKGLGKDYGTDYMAIHYFTPNFNGLTAAFTYAPNGTSDGQNDGQFAQNDNADGSNVFSVALNYKLAFDGGKLAVSGGYSDADGKDQEAYSLGADVTFSGIRAAVHYEENKGEDTGKDLAIGLSYSTGPWTAAVGYSVLLDAPAFVPASGSTAAKGGDVQVVAGWASYAVAPGVNGVVGVAFSDSDTGGSDSLGMAYLNLNF